MKVARIHKKLPQESEAVFKYTLYGRKYLYTENIPAIFSTEDPFLAYWTASNAPRSSENCILVTYIAKYVDNKYVYSIEQIRWIGGFMQIRHEGSYRTTILHTEDPNEFFAKAFQRKKFNLWQVIHNKRVDHILDFTRIYDSTMIMSSFSNRIRMRLDRGPEKITDERKIITARSAHFALVWTDEKNNFF